MFLKRTFSTVVLLCVFGAVIFAPSPGNKIVFFLLSIFLTFYLVREICDIVRNLGMETLKNTTALFCTLIVAIAGFICSDFYLSDFVNLMFGLLCYMLLFGIAIGCPLFILFSKNSGEKIKKLFNSFAVSVFTLIPLAFILAIYFFGETNKNLKINSTFLIFILLTKIGDIGAYVVGTASSKLMKGGNHKMVPSISPGKSWEGAAGGLIVTVLLALGFHYWCPQAILVRCIPFAVITGILMFFGSMAGDLMESALKRAAKVKDSGSTIPGIGGVFDLVDSLFVTAPVAVLLDTLLKICC